MWHIAMPVEEPSTASKPEIDSGAKTVHHRRNVTFQFVEVAILKSLFVEILRPPDRITSNPVR